MELNAFITSFHCFQEYSRKTVKIELKNCKLMTLFISDHSKTIHTGQIRPHNWLKDGGLWTILEGGKLWKNSRSKQKTEICWADFE